MSMDALADIIGDSSSMSDVAYMNPVNDLVSSPWVCSWDPDWYNFENFSFILYSRHADRSSYPLKLLVKKICVICVLLQFKLYMNCIPETQVCSRKSSGTRSENKKRLGYYQTHRTLWKSNKPGCTMIGKVNKNMIIWSTASKKEKKNIHNKLLSELLTISWQKRS